MVCPISSCLNTEMMHRDGANSLNQYESRTVPGIVRVTGSAVEDATVKIIRNADATVQVPIRNGRNFVTVK